MSDDGGLQDPDELLVYGYGYPGPVYVTHRDFLGRPYQRIAWAGPRASVAAVGYTVVASMLGAVLRKALDDHLAAHRCNEPRGSVFCREADELWALMPAGDRIMMG